jgi:hypothetical protein
MANATISKLTKIRPRFSRGAQTSMQMVTQQIALIASAAMDARVPGQKVLHRLVDTHKRGRTGCTIQIDIAYTLTIEERHFRAHPHHTWAGIGGRLGECNDSGECVIVIN